MIWSVQMGPNISIDANCLSCLLVDPNGSALLQMDNYGVKRVLAFSSGSKSFLVLLSGANGSKLELQCSKGSLIM